MTDDISMTHSEFTPVTVSHKTELPPVSDTAVQEAVERLKKFDEYMGRNEDFHALLASHAALLKENERLRVALFDAIDVLDNGHELRVRPRYQLCERLRAALTD